MQQQQPPRPYARPPPTQTPPGSSPMMMRPPMPGHPGHPGGVPMGPAVGPPGGPVGGMYPQTQPPPFRPPMQGPPPPQQFRPPLQQGPMQPPMAQSLDGAMQQMSLQQQQPPMAPPTTMTPTGPSPKVGRRMYPNAQPPPATPSFQGQPPPASLQQPLASNGIVPMAPPAFGTGTAAVAAEDQGPRRKVDAESLPSAAEWLESDQEEWDKAQEFRSSSLGKPPLATTSYLSVDDGVACPRFIRSTLYEIPVGTDVANNSNVPLTLVVQPLAEMRSMEAPVECIDTGDAGPVRCTRCKAYMNPFMRWVNGGQKFICNICDFANDTPQEYFCHLDMTGRRADLLQRPELRCGTVEFTATKEFCIRDPAPASFVFLIDVSSIAIQSGLVKMMAETIREMLDFFPMDDEDQCPCRVGFVAFDRAAHFFNLSPALSQPQMMVVSDLDELFVPLHTGFLVHPVENRDVVEAFLTQLPDLFAQNRTGEACIGPTVKAVAEALKKTGGRLVVLQTSLPTFGPGALKNREDPKLIGTDKEKQLFSPQDDYYKELAEKCVESGVGIDIFFCTTGYVDMATVGALASITGGHSFYYPHFHFQKDGARLAEDLRRIITRPFGYDCLLRARCSNGLRVDDHVGNFLMKNATDMECGVMDSETSFAINIKYDSKLQPQSTASFQIAMLYTSPLGKRVIRVINYQLRCTDQLTNIFKFADAETTLAALAKSAVGQITKSNLNTIRDALTDRCTAILLSYRKFCASSCAPSQMILPESFKVLPIYTLCLLKSAAFRNGTDVTSDLRVFEMRNIRSMTIPATLAYLYPRLYSLHDLPPNSCEYDPAVNRFRLPPFRRPSWTRIESYGVYLIENTQVLYLWLGKDVVPPFLMDLFAVSSLHELDVQLRSLPNLDTVLSKKVRALLQYIQDEERKGGSIQLQIIRQGEQTERQFLNLLVEDRNNDNMDYTDYLCHVHRQIQNILQDL